jgi:hypothetical protein
MKKPKRPRDTNQLAHFIIAAATGDADLPEKQETERAAIAKKAALSRWKKKD